MKTVLTSTVSVHELLIDFAQALYIDMRKLY